MVDNVGKVPMLQPVEVLATHRHLLRRAVDVGCELLAEGWETSVLHRVSDLSEAGAFIRGDLLLEPGDELLVDLVPPRQVRPMTVTARVERTVLRRRRRDRERSGMGVRFLDLGRDDRQRLRDSLEGLPPPLPAKARPAEEEWLYIEEVEAIDNLELDAAFDEAASPYFLTAGVRWWPGMKRTG